MISLVPASRCQGEKCRRPGERFVAPGEDNKKETWAISRENVNTPQTGKCLWKHMWKEFLQGNYE